MNEIENVEHVVVSSHFCPQIQNNPKYVPNYTSGQGQNIGSFHKTSIKKRIDIQIRVAKIPRKRSPGPVRHRTKSGEPGMNRSYYLASPHQSPATVIYTYSFVCFLGFNRRPHRGGGGDATPPPMSFSEMAAERLGGSR